MRHSHYTGALDGIRVLDISGGIAAGYCGKLFADHGADVLLVEPPEGFETRRVPPIIPGVKPPEASGMHAYLSTNKRSVVCDDSARLRELARGASLVIDGCATDERPLPVKELAQVAPNAALLSITWFGQDGPYRDFTGSDGVCMALASQIDWLGNAGEAPVIPGGYHAQIVAGQTAFIGAMGQVLAREIGNASGPAHIEVSVFEAGVCFTEIEAVRVHCGLPMRTRSGVNRFRTTYPLGIYPCRDGWLGVTVLTPSQWYGFCRLVGLERLAGIARYRSSEARYQDADTLDPVIAEAVSGMSAKELVMRGQEMKVPLSLVPTMEELFSVDQYVSRRVFADVTHPDLGSFPLPVTPFRLRGSPAIPGGQVARLGEDTESVLEMAGAAG